MRIYRRKRMLWVVVTVIAMVLVMCGCTIGGGHALELTIDGKTLYYGMEQAEAEKILTGGPSSLGSMEMYENATVIFRDGKLVLASTSENAKCGGIAIGDSMDKVLEKYRDILEMQKPYLVLEDVATLEDYLQKNHAIDILYWKNDDRVEPFEGTVLEFREQIMEKQREARGDLPTNYYYLSFNRGMEDTVGTVNFADYRAALRLK